MRRWLIVLLRVAVGGVFLWAAATKIAQAGPLAETMVRFRLLPQVLTLPFAYFLPWLELFCGLALVTGVWLRGGASWAVALLLIFSGALTLNLIRGIDVACGCFGQGPETGSTASTLVRDLALLPPALFIAWEAFRNRARLG